jgi:hypothetical protein
MTVRDVAIVLSPVLGIPAGLFSLMLGEFNRVFNADNGYDAESSAGEKGDPTPRVSGARTGRTLARTGVTRRIILDATTAQTRLGPKAQRWL